MFHEYFLINAKTLNLRVRLSTSSGIVINLFPHQHDGAGGDEECPEGDFKCQRLLEYNDREDDGENDAELV